MAMAVLNFEWISGQFYWHVRPGDETPPSNVVYDGIMLR